MAFLVVILKNIIQCLLPEERTVTLQNHYIMEYNEILLGTESKLIYIARRLIREAGGGIGRRKYKGA